MKENKTAKNLDSVWWFFFYRMEAEANCEMPSCIKRFSPFWSCGILFKRFALCKKNICCLYLKKLTFCYRWLHLEWSQMRLAASTAAISMLQGIFANKLSILQQQKNTVFVPLVFWYFISECLNMIRMWDEHLVLLFCWFFNFLILLFWVFLLSRKLAKIKPEKKTMCMEQSSRGT